MKYKLDKNKFKAIESDCGGITQDQIARAIVKKYPKDKLSTWTSKISNAIYEDDYSPEKRATPKRLIEESDIKRMLSAINNTYGKSYKISDIIKCETAKSSPPLIFCEVSKIYKYYESLGVSDVISIVSSDGFLEAIDKDLFEHMLKQVYKGVEIRYYYPENPENESLKDYASLINQYGNFLSPEDSKKFIWGFAVPLQHGRFFGYNTRHIIISKWTDSRKKQIVQHALLYTETSSDDNSPNKSKQIWIHLSDDNGQKYYSELCKSAEPIRDLGIYQNRLDLNLQKAYQNALSVNSNLQIYHELCSKLDPDSQTLSKLKDEISKRVKRIINGKQSQRNSIVSILDIGSGDGRFIDGIIEHLEEVLGERTVIQLTCIEPANIPRHLLSNRLKNISVLHEMATFEEYDFSNKKYDLILSTHSTYLIDTTYLLKMYTLLRDDGHLFIVTSPYDGNVVNGICGLIDNNLPYSDTRMSSDAYEGKFITEDPLRNYAEDIEAYAIDKFNKVDTVKYVSEILFSDLISNDKLTEFCEKLFTLFSYGMLNPKDVQKTQENIKAYLDKIASNGQLTNETWMICISKQDAQRYLSKLYNGVVNSW